MFLQDLGTRDTVQGVHIKRSGTHEEARSAEGLLFVVIAQDVADILTEETLDALAKFLYTVDIALVHLPFNAGPRLKGRNLPIHGEVPGDVGHQILNDWECLHGEDSDGLI